MEKAAPTMSRPISSLVVLALVGVCRVCISRYDSGVLWGVAQRGGRVTARAVHAYGCGRWADAKGRLALIVGLRVYAHSCLAALRGLGRGIVVAGRIVVG